MSSTKRPSGREDATTSGPAQTSQAANTDMGSSSQLKDMHGHRHERAARLVGQEQVRISATSTARKGVFEESERRSRSDKNPVEQNEDGLPSKRPKAFRFKSETYSQQRASRGDNRHRSSRRRSSDHKHRRRSRSPMRARSPGPRPRSLSPNTAFRESLFDAMADDEGAAYWESVYGQPIHIYQPTSRHMHSGETYEGADYNNPDILDADAYAAYVRRKMWEKSHEHILEERRRREEEAEKLRKQREEDAKYAKKIREDLFGDRSHHQQKSRFASDIEAGLKRGEQRREGKKWKQAWSEYSKKWETLLERPGTDGGSNQQASSNEAAPAKDASLPWPVLSGLEQDVNANAVREFFRQISGIKCHEPGRDSTTAASLDGCDFLRSQLKLERVRWHPDKVMQRFQVNHSTLQTVTAVFQVIDQMWSEEKARAKT